MSKKLLALYGLKFNPFSSQVPTDALWSPPPIEDFCWRIEQQIGEGGFALVTGDPGTGKSAALRLLAQRLARVRDLSLGVLTRPQASLADFYRELGHLFGVALSPQQLLACLQHLLNAAGNPKLLSPALLQTLSEHAAGNLRLLINLGNDLLQAALRQERDLLDEKLYFEVFASEPKPRTKRP